MASWESVLILLLIYFITRDDHDSPRNRRGKKKKFYCEKTVSVGFIGAEGLWTVTRCDTGPVIPSFYTEKHLKQKWYALLPKWLHLRFYAASGTTANERLLMKSCFWKGSFKQTKRDTKKAHAHRVIWSWLFSSNCMSQNALFLYNICLLFVKQVSSCGHLRYSSCKHSFLHHTHFVLSLEPDEAKKRSLLHT